MSILTFEGFQQAQHEDAVASWFKAAQKCSSADVSAVVRALMVAYGVAEVSESNFNTICYRYDSENKQIIWNTNAIATFQYLRENFPEKFRKALPERDYQIMYHLDQIEDFGEKYRTALVLGRLMVFLRSRVGSMLRDDVYVENIDLCAFAKRFVNSNKKFVENPTERFQQIAQIRRASIDNLSS